MAHLGTAPTELARQLITAWFDLSRYGPPSDDPAMIARVMGPIQAIVLDIQAQGVEVLVIEELVSQVHGMLHIIATVTGDSKEDIWRGLAGIQAECGGDDT
jgi:hypothetical protein